MFHERFEASIICAHLNKFLKLVKKDNDIRGPASHQKNYSIGVTTPYSAQLRLLEREIRKRCGDTFANRTRVKTIDGFQGGEVDVLVISCVRSNKHGTIGFLGDPARVNVALTRARYGLWVFGDSGTLGRKDVIWRAFVDHCSRRACVLEEAEQMRNFSPCMRKFIPSFQTVSEIFLTPFKIPL